SYIVSALMIARITTLGHGVGRASDAQVEVGEQAHVRFRDAFAIPLVRAVLPATISVALGLGALFSLGIDFVRKVLHASDAQFGVLVALFGVGAGCGLLVMQRTHRVDRLRATRLAVAALGLIVGF